MPAFPNGRHAGRVVPLDRANVDTDAIFPKQYGKSTARSGFGQVLFDEWRYLAPGDLNSDHASRPVNPDFVLNRAELCGATVLLARENFGCGSSREHAVWAMRDYGFRAVIAQSFGDIFRQNCPLNGVAAIELRPADVASLFVLAAAGPLTLEIDLHAGRVHAGGVALPFGLAPRETALLTQDGDWIGVTLAGQARIASFEAGHLARRPWLAKVLRSP